MGMTLRARREQEYEAEAQALRTRESKAAQCDIYRAFITETGKTQEYLVWWAQRSGISEASQTELAAALSPPTRKE